RFTANSRCVSLGWSLLSRAQVFDPGVEDVGIVVVRPGIFRATGALSDISARHAGRSCKWFLHSFVRVLGPCQRTSITCAEGRDQSDGEREL
ncbi:MAG: hypothetical protein WBN79_15290, partial [Gemmatimonadota bacterium]